MQNSRKIHVDLTWKDYTFEVGTLLFSYQRGCEACAFAYTEEWLCNPFKFALDPALPLISGVQYAPHDRVLFGCFSDSAPDRWGRDLLWRKQMQSQKNSSLFESDYLLGVFDHLRMGGLRYRNGGDYLFSPPTGVSQLKKIHEFYAAIRHIQNGGTGVDNDITDILGPASSLGGARPKITLESAEGQLYIAKFPSLKDLTDVPLWEKISLDMAKDCGISTVPSSLVSLGDGRHTLICQRFDRDGGRIPYASAMTMLNAVDGASRQYGYLDIAESLQASGVDAATDIRELWRRMLFNVLTSNRDDHLRNHGFLRKENGWKLSPVFDLESDGKKPFHSLCLDDHGTISPDPNAVLSVCEYYDVMHDEAISVAEEMYDVVSGWEKYADRYNANRKEKNKMRGNYLLDTSWLSKPMRPH